MHVAVNFILKLGWVGDRAEHRRRGRRGSLVNAQGLRLATYWWPAATEQPKAVVQLFHGNAAYVMEFLRTQVHGQAVLPPARFIAWWPLPYTDAVSKCPHAACILDTSWTPFCCK